MASSIILLLTTLAFCIKPARPKGFNKTIKCGSNVRAASRAINIAKLVNKPKYIVGLKFENILLLD